MDEGEWRTRKGARGRNLVEIKTRFLFRTNVPRTRVFTLLFYIILYKNQKSCLEAIHNTSFFRDQRLDYVPFSVYKTRAFPSSRLNSSSLLTFFGLFPLLSPPPPFFHAPSRLMKTTGHDVGNQRINKPWRTSGLSLG